MSGGSFNYLCRAFTEIYPPEDIYRMLHELEEGSPEHAATKRVIGLFEELRKETDSLYNVWKAVEWKCSGDWGPEQVTEAIEEYRALEPNGHDDLSANIEAKFEIDNKLLETDSPYGFMIIRMTIDGNQIATASSSKIFFKVSSEDFNVGPEGIVKELTSVLLRRVKGEDMRTTVLGWKGVPHQDGLFIGRVLVRKNDHTEGHILEYDMRDGRTGPLEISEPVRERFKRAIHTEILNALKSKGS